MQVQRYLELHIPHDRAGIPVERQRRVRKSGGRQAAALVQGGCAPLLAHATHPEHHRRGCFQLLHCPGQQHYPGHRYVCGPFLVNDL